MKSGAQALMDEIRRSHYSNMKPAEANSSSKTTAPVSKDAEPNPAEKKTRRRRRRVENPPVADDAKMFTISVIGGMNLPGYPLQNGEKLVVAKLTPIPPGT